MSYRSTGACKLLLCDTSLNLLKLLSMCSRRSSKFWFFLSSSVLEVFKVTKKFANSFVWTDMRIKIIGSNFSTIRNLTCRGLLSGIQMIVVMKCSLCRASGVHLQRISSLKCVLSPGRFKVISIGFIQIINEVSIVLMVW